MPVQQKAAFIEPMECLAVSHLPTGQEWLWELKLDGYRAIGLKTDKKVHLYSRNGKSFDQKFSHIKEALTVLPDETIVDGEIVALGEDGRPDFQMLQNFGSAADQISYFVFDLLRHKGRDLTRLPLIERRKLLKSLKITSDRVRVADYFEVDSSALLAAAREQKLEGIVGKRKESRYEAGERSGAWIKYRLNVGQEFVIGGFTPGPHGIDALIIGYYNGDQLMYAARTRNGFVPASRRRVFETLRPLVTEICPFANLPETRKQRWGEALTAEKIERLSVGPT